MPPMRPPAIAAQLLTWAALTCLPVLHGCDGDCVVPPGTYEAIPKAPCLSGIAPQPVRVVVDASRACGRFVAQQTQTIAGRDCEGSVIIDVEMTSTGLSTARVDYATHCRDGSAPDWVCPATADLVRLAEERD